MRPRDVIGNALLFALVVSLMVAGCGANDPADSRSSGSAAASVPERGDTCQDKHTTPFTVEELLEGLRKAGYEMYIAPGCSNREASWQLTNYDIAVPEIESGDYKVTLAREGTVDCYLFGDGHDSGSRVRTKSYEGEDLVYFRVLNVGCDMRPDPAQRAKQVARLEETLNQLAASQTP